MKNSIYFPISAQRSLCVASSVLCIGLLSDASLLGGEASANKSSAEPTQTETEYTNWFNLETGGVLTHGDAAQFKQEHRMSDVFGGIEDMHFENAMGKAQFTIDARAIFGNDDYRVKLELSKACVGYIRAGYTQYRTWYDGNGGFFPLNGAFFSPLGDNELALDRGNAWIELGLREPNLPEITLRYSHEFREGNKDSTLWGPTTATGLAAAAPPNDDPLFTQRNIVPSFRHINEQRDIFTADATQAISNTDLTLGMRYEHTKNHDTLNELQYPENSPFDPNYPQHTITQNDQLTSDLFNGHFSTITRFSDKLWLALAYSYTTIDTGIGGDRTHGLGSDASCTSAVPIDGFLNLGGGANTSQHVANLTLTWAPFDAFTIASAVRVEKSDITNTVFYTQTASDTGTSTVPTFVSSEYDYLNVAESLELRYSGIKNWLFYATGNWEEENGARRDIANMSFLSLTDPLNFDADVSTLRQKYAVGANWYPLSGLVLAVQYYHNSVDNHHNLISDDGGAVCNTRLMNMDRNTDDVNARITWRPLSSLALVSRYDMQYTTINSGWEHTNPMNPFPQGDSGKITNYMFTESVTWNPTDRMYCVGNVAYVLNQTKTPASLLVPSVLDFKNNYWTASCTVGIALDDKTNLEADYSYYRANDYVNNATSTVGAAGGMPYGASDRENVISATLSRQITRNVRWILKYSYYMLAGQTSGGHNSYDSNLIYSSLQIRF